MCYLNILKRSSLILKFVNYILFIFSLKLLVSKGSVCYLLQHFHVPISFINLSVLLLSENYKEDQEC